MPVKKIFHTSNHKTEAWVVEDPDGSPGYITVMSTSSGAKFHLPIRDGDDSVDQLISLLKEVLQAAETNTY